MVQNWSFYKKWLRKFKTIIIDYTKHRTPDPFMNRFRQRDSERARFSFLIKDVMTQFL